MDSGQKEKNPHASSTLPGGTPLRPGHGLLLFAGAMTCYLIWIAARLNIDYFDSYENLWNGLCLSGISDFRFSWKRPLLLPLCISPLFYAERLTGWLDFGYRASHVASVFFFAALLWAVYRLFRMHLDRQHSAWAALLLGLNPLLIRHAPFAKEDILGTLVLTAAFYFYLKTVRRRRIRDYIACGFFLACAVASRVNFLPAVFSILILYEILSRQTRFTLEWRSMAALNPEAGKKAAFLFILPAVLFLAVLSAVYARFGLSGFWGAAGKYFADIGFLMRLYADDIQSPRQNYEFLLLACTWPVLITAAIGFLRSVTARRHGALFHALWFSVFFVLQTYLINQKESRYLFPALPSLYFFAGAGLEELSSVLRVRLKSFRFAVILRRAVVLALLILPAGLAFQAAAGLRDPVYSVPYQERVSRYAGSLAGGRDILWLGTYYAMHPKNYLFHPEDEFTAVYHFYNHVIRFFTRTQTRVISGHKLLPAMPGEGMVFAGPNLRSLASDGTVLVINPDPTVYVTENIPNRMPPLLVERVREIVFDLTPTQDAGPALFEAADPAFPDARLSVEFSPAGALITGSGISDRRYELYFFLADGAPLPVSIVTVRNGQLRYEAAEITRPVPVKKISLLYYDGLRVFQPPMSESSEAEKKS